MKRNRFLIISLISFLIITSLFFQISRSQAEKGKEVTQNEQSYDQIHLILKNSDEFYWSGTLPSNEKPTIGLTLPDGTVLADGQYQYELQYISNLSPKAVEIMEQSHEATNRAEIEAQLRADGLLPEIKIETGSFMIQNRALILDSVERGESIASNDLSLLADMHLTDVSIQGSSCTGFDCVNGESFGFDTIRLKENNLRLHFNDTSATGSFPTTDWRILINDTTNGGSSYFAIEDSDAARVPFKIEANAPTNSLFVKSNGDIGIGTNTPVVKVHVADGDTPTVRLDQTGASGFTPQIWDMAGNETNFFIRDVTNGTRLPFRIRPQAPTNSIYINTNGDVGLGTADPDKKLHIVGTAANTTTISIENSTNRWDISNTGSTLIINTEANTATTAFILDDNGNLILSGALTEASDRHLKENINSVDTEQILAEIAQLPLQTWNYIRDGSDILHLGVMAQDFHAAFGLGIDNKHISPLDVNGVALGGIQALIKIDAVHDAELQALNNQLTTLQSEVAALQAENKELEQRLLDLEMLVNTLIANQQGK